jgi:dTDP-4-amino-4,6-dideoxygalactose transaminase
VTTPLAIDGGPPVRTQPWPSWPVWDDRELQALTDTLRSGAWAAIGGTQVHALEQEFALAHGARHGIACASGSAALEVALRAAGIDWGDEVLTTAYTFIATANACLLLGALPRFADVLPGTWNIDPESVRRRITPRTRAIVAVHIAGEPADMDALRQIAREHSLPLIEDSAQAHGARWRGQPVGSMGDMGTFSFQISKNMNAGEGGMVLSNSDAYAERCWSIVNVGRQREGAFYHHAGLSGNYRLPEWPAAVLRVQLQRLEEQSARRSENAAYLFDAVDEVPGLTPVRGDARVTQFAHHLVRFMYAPEQFNGRPPQDFVRAMIAEGIPIQQGYPIPLSRHPVVVERSAFIRTRLGMPQEAPDRCPVCEKVCAQGLWLPQWVLLADYRAMDDIVRAAQRIQQAWA